MLLFAANASAAPAGIRVGPLQSARPGVRPLIPFSHLGRSTVTSNNWSGYAATGKTFSDVKGSWVEPSVSCTSRGAAYSAFSDTWKHS